MKGTNHECEVEDIDPVSGADFDPLDDERLPENDPYPFWWDQPTFQADLADWTARHITRVASECGITTTETTWNGLAEDLNAAGFDTYDGDGFFAVYPGGQTCSFATDPDGCDCAKPDLASAAREVLAAFEEYGQGGGDYLTDPDDVEDRDQRREDALSVLNSILNP